MNESAAAVLAVLSVLALVALWSRRGGGRGALQKRLRVVAAVALGPGRTLSVVRAGRRVFLIGASGRELSSIAELDSQDWPESEPAPVPALLTGFTAALGRRRAGASSASSKP